MLTRAALVGWILPWSAVLADPMPSPGYFCRFDDGALQITVGPFVIRADTVMEGFVTTSELVQVTDDGIEGRRHYRDGRQPTPFQVRLPPDGPAALTGWDGPGATAILYGECRT